MNSKLFITETKKLWVLIGGVISLLLLFSINAYCGQKVIAVLRETQKVVCTENKSDGLYVYVYDVRSGQQQPGSSIIAPIILQNRDIKSVADKGRIGVIEFTALVQDPKTQKWFVGKYTPMTNIEIPIQDSEKTKNIVFSRYGNYIILIYKNKISACKVNYYNKTIDAPHIVDNLKDPTHQEIDPNSVYTNDVQSLTDVLTIMYAINVEGKALQKPWIYVISDDGNKMIYGNNLCSWRPSESWWSVHSITWSNPGHGSYNKMKLDCIDNNFNHCGVRVLTKKFYYNHFVSAEMNDNNQIVNYGSEYDYNDGNGWALRNKNGEYSIFMFNNLEDGDCAFCPFVFTTMAATGNFAPSLDDWCSSTNTTSGKYVEAKDMDSYDRYEITLPDQNHEVLIKEHQDY